MNGEQIYIALGNVDDTLLTRYHERTTYQRKSKPWTKYGAIAACLCLVILSFFALNTRFAKDGLLTGEIYKAGGKVIASFPSGSSSSCYATPQPGTWFCFTEVTNALKKYAEKDVTYFLAIDIFTETEALDADSKEIIPELKRLSKSGYHVGYAEAWTYQGQGEKVPYTYVAGYFTAEDLQSFNASKDFGYAFHFPTNGDGSPISSDKIVIWDYD